MTCWIALEISLFVAFALTILALFLIPPAIQQVILLHLTQGGIHLPTRSRRRYGFSIYHPAGWLSHWPPTWSVKLPPCQIKHHLPLVQLIPQTAGTKCWELPSLHGTGGPGLPLPTQVHMRPEFSVPAPGAEGLASPTNVCLNHFPGSPRPPTAKRTKPWQCLGLE